MPRRLRHAAGGYVYHVLNRAVGRATLFQKPGDYHAFRKVLEQAKDTKGTGPLYQSRFKSFPIEEDTHLLTVLRYVERNPSCAPAWWAQRCWSSLGQAYQHLP